MVRGKGSARHAQNTQTEEGTPACPLCIEPLDSHEQHWFPCPCGYQVCAFCHQRLQLEHNNQCPGCRTEYGKGKEASHTADPKSRKGQAKTAKALPKRLPNGYATAKKPTGTNADSTSASLSKARGEERKFHSTENGNAAPIVGQDEIALSHIEDVSDSPSLASSFSEQPTPVPSSSGSLAPGKQQKAVNEAGQSSKAGQPPPNGKRMPWVAPVSIGDYQLPSPTKWPELGTSHTETSKHSGSLPSSEMTPSKTGETASLSTGDASSGSGTSSSGEALWDLLLSGGRGVPDAQGLQMRAAIEQAVASGRMSSREGAGRLVTYLQTLMTKAQSPDSGLQELKPESPAPSKAHFAATVARVSEPHQVFPGQVVASGQHISSTEPKNGFLLRPHPSGIRNRSTTGSIPEVNYSSGLNAGTSSRSSEWLQSGVISGLGLSSEPSSDSLRAKWTFPQEQPSLSSAWVSKHVDADAVPDSLQELWGNAKASSSGREDMQNARLASNQVSSQPFSGMGRADPFAALMSQPPLANGFSSQRQSGAHALPENLLGLSQGVDSALRGGWMMNNQGLSRFQNNPGAGAAAKTSVSSRGLADHFQHVQSFPRGSVSQELASRHSDSGNGPSLGARSFAGNSYAAHPPGTATSSLPQWLERPASSPQPYTGSSSYFGGVDYARQHSANQRPSPASQPPWMEERREAWEELLQKRDGGNHDPQIAAQQFRERFSLGGGLYNPTKVYQQ